VSLFADFKHILVETPAVRSYAGHPTHFIESHRTQRRWLADTSKRIPAQDRPCGGATTRPAELAGKQIEKMIDPSALADERDRRRRRRTKGLLEFREHRVDLPKAQGK
jgi:hypothetical protein